MVTVLNGVNSVEAESLVGKTVAEARAQVRQMLNVSPEAVAHVNDEPVESTHVLRADDTLEFIKSSGVKGQVA